MNLPATAAGSAVISDRVRFVDPKDGTVRWAPAVLAFEPATGRFTAVEEGQGALARARETARQTESQHRVDDQGDRPITPAFVNAHTHLALAFLRGPEVARGARGNLVEDLFYVRERALFPEDVRAFVRMGAYESLLAGVGLVWDHYYFGDAVADGLRDTGLAGVVAPTLQDLAGPGAERTDAALATTEALAGRRELESRGIFAALGPHATDTVSGGTWRTAVDLARKLRLPIHAHLAQSAEEVARVEAREGAGPVPWLVRLGVLEEAPASVFAHGLFLRASDLELLKEAGASRGRLRHLLVHCPSAQAVFAFPAGIRRWAARRLPFAVATDSAAGNDSMSLQKELRLVAAARTVDLTAGPAYEAFFRGGTTADAQGALAAVEHARAARHRDPETAALGAPARLLERVFDLPGAAHPGFQAGTLSPGALASFIVWDHQHPSFWPASDLDRCLAYGDTTGAIHRMVVAGREVGRPGEVAQAVRASDAYREARREADDRLAALLARLPPGRAT